MAALLLRANTWVSVDSLQDAIWPEGPPRSVRNNLKTYVHQARQLLAAAGDRARVESRQGWYRINVDTAELDAAVFERAVHDGKKAFTAGAPTRAVDTLHAGLAAW